MPNCWVAQSRGYLNGKFCAILFPSFVTCAVELRHVSFFINEYNILLNKTIRNTKIF